MSKHTTIDEFTSAVASNTPEGYDLCFDSCATPDDNGYGCGECEACANTDEFSSRRCATCGTDLAGARHPLAYVSPELARAGSDDAVIRVAGCTDCLLYVANGDIPDNLTAD